MLVGASPTSSRPAVSGESCPANLCLVWSSPQHSHGHRGRARRVVLLAAALAGGLPVWALTRSFTAASAASAVLPACRGRCGAVATPRPSPPTLAVGPAPSGGVERHGARGPALAPGLVIPRDPIVAQRLDPGHWRELVSSYHDWNARLMLRVAWCESRDEWWQVNPLSVAGGQHARGVLQVLGGSLNPVVNVRQAHARFVAQGLSAWASSRSCWGVGP